MQAKHQAGRLRRLRRMAEIFGAQLGKTELFLASDFPQKVEVDFGGDRLRVADQLRRRGRGKLQQHILGLDLGALAARQLDLISLALLPQYGAGLEVAGFFEK